MPRTKLSNIGQGIGRWLASFWRFTGKAPGWYYQAIEQWGSHLASEPVIAKMMGDLQVQCDLRDEVQRQIYFIGLYEPIEAYLFAKMVRAGMTVFDIGANVGQYSLLASIRVGVNGQVHAFEPVPSTFANLKRNITNNQLENVSLCCHALWYERSELKLGILPEFEGRNSGGYTTTLPESGSVIKASAITLDEYVNENHVHRVDVCKIDIEGAELFALRGMARMLERHKPIILMEINRLLDGRAGYTPEHVFQFLRQFGYRAWVVGASAAECYDAADFNGIETKNVIFHTASLPSEVVSGWNLKSILRWVRLGNVNSLV